MVRAVNLLAGAMSLFSVASAGASMSKRADGDTFNLYAYGTGIGGLPISEWQGLPYIVDSDQLNDTSITPELITFTISNGTWLASTNSSSLNNSTFFVPAPGTNTTAPGFVNGTISDPNDIWSGFFFYGHIAMLRDSDGVMQTLFMAMPTATAGMWSLAWNGTSDDSGVIIALKDTPPSTSSSSKKLKRRSLW